MHSPWMYLCALCTILSTALLVNAGVIHDQRSAEARYRKPVPIGEHLYSAFKFYTEHASAAYQENCPNPPHASVQVQYIDVKKTTTQAVIFRNDRRKEFILAFPGTRGRVDRQLDGEYQLTPANLYGIPPAECPGCMLHTGFRAAWESIAPHVAKALRGHLKVRPDYQIVITGHSLGGAISSMATASLRRLKFPIRATFTMGQPRTGNPEYANYIDKISHVVHGSRGTFHRIVHAGDGVPHTPGEESGYRHHSTEYWEKNDHKTHNQTAARTWRCFGQESPYCSDSITPQGVINQPHGFYSGVNMGNRYVCH